MEGEEVQQGQVDVALKRRVVDELREKRKGEPPVPTSDINIVWVVPGHSTVSTLPPEDGTRNVLYKKRLDDLERVSAGINLVRAVTALRLTKKVEEVTREDIEANGPILYYNGGEAQNKDLEKMIGDPDFILPKSKVVIDEIEDVDTRGQVKGMGKYLEGQTATVAVVAHGVHGASRIPRQVERYKNLFPNITFKEFTIRETKVPVGSTLGEIRRIVKYSKKGDLSREPAY